MKNLCFAPYDPGWLEVLLGLLDHYWHTDRACATFTLGRVGKETGDPALALELARAWFQHAIALPPGVIPIHYPDGTPVSGDNGEPTHREVVLT